MTLKTRVIPILLYKDRLLIKGQQFNGWRRVGVAMQAVKVHEARCVDELIILDIGATLNGRGPDYDMIRDLTTSTFMPVTYGGGITNIDQVSNLMRVGADKISLGTAAWTRPDLVTDIARRYGSQAVVVSIDVDSIGLVRIGCGTLPTGKDPVAYARNLEDLGAGEILLNDIQREGTMSGYDLELIHNVASRVKIPVIAACGAGTYEHMADALRAGAHAVAAGAMFAFSEATPKGAAHYLSQHGFPTRLAA